MLILMHLLEVKVGLDKSRKLRPPFWASYGLLTVLPLDPGPEDEDDDSLEELNVALGEGIGLLPPPFTVGEVEDPYRPASGLQLG